MWSQKTPNGKYQFYERYTDPVTGMKHTVSVRMERDTNATHKAAQKLLSDKIAAKLQAPALTRRMTLRELIALYIDRPGIRASTRHKDEMVARTLLSVIGPDADISRLTAGYINMKFADAGRSDEVSLYRLIRGAMTWAYNNDYVDNIDWLAKLKTPQKSKPKAADLYLEPRDLKTLLAAMPEMEWRDLTEFLVLSGLRVGEALDLTQDDVDGDVLHIDSALDLHTNESGPTKTVSSVRDVTITPELRECIDRIIARHPTSHSLFCGKGGRVARYDAYYAYLRKKSFRALGRHVHPHTLRHTYTSLMAAAGIPLDVISRQLGHENSQITRAVYFHVTESLKKKDADMIKTVRLLT